MGSIALCDRVVGVEPISSKDEYDGAVNASHLIVEVSQHGKKRNLISIAIRKPVPHAVGDFEEMP